MAGIFSELALSDAKAVCMPGLAASLRSKCVGLGSRLGARYTAAAALRTTTEDASRRLQRAAAAAAAAATSGGGVVEPTDVEGEKAAQVAEPILESMVAMLRGVTQWDAYMRGRTGGDGQAAGESLRHAAPFSEMARATVGLNHFWAATAVARAVRTHLGKLTSSTPATDTAAADKGSAAGNGGAAGAAAAEAAAANDGALSELVDSSFYVLQTALRRAAHTCDGGIATAAAKHAGGVLTTTLLGHLQSLLRESISSKLAGAALGSVLEITTSAADGAAAMARDAAARGLGGERAATLAGAALGSVSAVGAVAGASRQAALLRTLSALQTCMGYTPRLWQQASDDFHRSLPPAAIGPAKAQLAEASATTAAFEHARDSGLAQLGKGMLFRLRNRLESFGSVSYVLETDAAFAAHEADSFVTPLLAELEGQTKPLAPLLVEEARDALLLLLVAGLAERLESLLLAKRLDQLGALQLDRELRAVTKRLGELTTKSVREKLARLTQMVTLLNLETESEAAELWGGSGGGWRLSAAEVKQVLGLRVDFRKESINGLTLG